jgi:hypothetical protein
LLGTDKNTSDVIQTEKGQEPLWKIPDDFKKSVNATVEIQSPAIVTPSLKIEASDVLKPSTDLMINKKRKKREKKNDSKVLLTQADMNEVKKVGRPRKVLAKLS